MDTLNTIAIDDELPALQVIETYCRELPYIKLQKTFHKPGEALRWLEQHPVDLMFIDIQMPSRNGIDLFRSVQQECMAIFTTAFSEYAVEGFQVQAVDYLLKPFSPERFKQATDRALQLFQLRRQAASSAGLEFIYLRVDYNLVKIVLNEIIFIEGLDDYLKIHRDGQPPLMVRMTMKAMLEKLPAKLFIRVHRSYIIPLKRVEKVRNRMIHIAGEEIPLGNSYAEAFFLASGL
jgi:DNA-binding LytR/AlgR family response regulator